MLTYITYLIFLWSIEVAQSATPPRTHEYIGEYLTFDYYTHWKNGGSHFIFIPHVSDSFELHSCLLRFEGEDSPKESYHWYVTQPTLEDKKKPWYIRWEE